ncbi:nuclear transport factor 2 family protein [Actinoplanes sp. CA-054009]
MSAREIVLTAVGQLFGDKDPSAADRWASPSYIQHSSLGPDGPAGLRGLVAKLPPTFRYEIHRVITDGDEVALHGTYYGFGPVPMVAFDIFRVADGKLAEHWDALMPQTSPAEVDGVTEVTDLGATEANRALVAASVTNQLHKIVAEGNFVLTVSSSADTAFYDLYNVSDGRITTDWQVARPIPAQLPHNNGLF